MTHSEYLREKIRLISSGLDRAAHSFWTHPDVRELYPELLFTIHCFSRATTRLMEIAQASARMQSHSDPAASCLAEYLWKHIPEERGHDDWLLEDLEILGFKRDHVLKRIPCATAAALAGVQYYWIFHAHPVAILGYLAVMEGEPPSVQYLQGVISRTGLPKEAFRTYFTHAALDLKHRDDLFRVLDNMPLTQDHVSLIGISAFQTIHFLRLAFEELVESRCELLAAPSLV